MFKKFGAVALAASMFVSGTAFAAANANQGALTQGQPATVKQAESYHGHQYLWWLVGGGVVVGGILLVAGGGHGSTLGAGVSCPLTNCIPVTPTTTTTTTTTTKP
jgi:hypothetical protein